MNKSLMVIMKFGLYYKHPKLHHFDNLLIRVRFDLALLVANRGLTARYQVNKQVTCLEYLAAPVPLSSGVPSPWDGSSPRLDHDTFFAMFAIVLALHGDFSRPLFLPGRFSIPASPLPSPPLQSHTFQYDTHVTSTHVTRKHPDYGKPLVTNKVAA